MAAGECIASANTWKKAIASDDAALVIESRLVMKQLAFGTRTLNLFSPDTPHGIGLSANLYAEANPAHGTNTGLSSVRASCADALFHLTGRRSH